MEPGDGWAPYTQPQAVDAIADYAHPYSLDLITPTKTYRVRRVYEPIV